MIPRLGKPYFYRLEFLELLRAYPRSISEEAVHILSNEQLIELQREVPVLPADTIDEETLVIGELDTTAPEFQYVRGRYDRLLLAAELLGRVDVPLLKGVEMRVRLLTAAIQHYRLMHGMYRWASARAKLRRLYRSH